MYPKDYTDFMKLLHKTIKRHAGLSDWDDDGIEAEVRAIVRAMKRNGYTFYV